MDKIDLIPKIRELYSRGENIIQFLRNQSGKDLNTIEDILISYDFQAGSYIKFASDNPQYIDAYTGEIANVLNGLGDFNTVLEAGVGEATTLANLSTKLNASLTQIMGFDISWSRIKYGRQYLKEKQVTADLFVADLFNIPLPDNSIDILYTSHSIEPNGGKEKEALAELYRVAKKYLVLLEPTFEFASEEGKIRMKKNGYVKDLKMHIEELNYNLTTYRPFTIVANPLNPTGLYVVKKDESLGNANTPIFCCPISRSQLSEHGDHLFFTESLISYPKIMGIPCICPSYGVLTTKHE